MCLCAFVDSGAAGSFMEFKMAQSLAIYPVTLQETLNITAVDGSPLGSGRVSQCTPPLQLQVGNHQELIQFFLIHTPRLPIILGYPWLTVHNPNIDWSRGVHCQLSNTAFCCSPELKSDKPKSNSIFGLKAPATEVKAVPSMEPVTSKPPPYPPEPPRNTWTSSKSSVKSKFLHWSYRSYYCAIELVPGTFFPLWPWEISYGQVSEGSSG